MTNCVINLNKPAFRDESLNTTAIESNLIAYIKDSNNTMKVTFYANFDGVIAVVEQQNRYLLFNGFRGNYLSKRHIQRERELDFVLKEAIQSGICDYCDAKVKYSNKMIPTVEVSYLLNFPIDNGELHLLTKSNVNSYKSLL